MVTSNAKQFRLNKFSSGLNTIDNQQEILDSELLTADNVEYLPNGEVKSVDGNSYAGQRSITSIDYTFNAEKSGTVDAVLSNYIRIYSPSSGISTGNIYLYNTYSSSIIGVYNAFFVDSTYVYVTISTSYNELPLHSSLNFRKVDNVLVRSAGHGFSNSDVITIGGTNNYNSSFTISNCSTDYFTIPYITYYPVESSGYCTKPTFVNSIESTKNLGMCEFNNYIYAMISNGATARLMRSTGAIAVAGAYSQVSAVDFDKDAIVKFQVYGDKLYFVNGKQETVTSYANRTLSAVADLVGTPNKVRFTTTANHGYVVGTMITIAGTTNYNGSYYITNVAAANTFDVISTYVAESVTGSVTPDNTAVLFVCDTSGNITGVGTPSGLPSGVNTITMHLERLFLGYNNYLYISKQYPTGIYSDWDTSTVYTGADTAGYILIDNDTTESIKELKTYFSQLAIFRTKSINIMTGTEILTSTITKASNAKTGCISGRSVSRSGNGIYFLSQEGLKIFRGNTVQEGTTNLDSLETITIDRQIKSLIDEIASKSTTVGYAFRDKYYISDDTYIYVLDEVTSVEGKFSWSRWSVPVESFVDFNGSLYAGKAGYLFKLNNNNRSSVSSTIKTKQFNLQDEIFYKQFEQLLLRFRVGTSINTFTLNWYLDGSSTASGTETISVYGSGLKYNNGYKYNSGVKYNSFSVNFYDYMKRKLLLGRNISFELVATGKNRFSLSALNLIYETTKRGA